MNDFHFIHFILSAHFEPGLVYLPTISLINLNGRYNMLNEF